MNPVTSVLWEFLGGVGRSFLFLLSLIAGLPSALLRPRLIAQQMYVLGVLSMTIIVISGSFIGMVLALQGYRTLSRFGASESLGVLVADRKSVV